MQGDATTVLVICQWGVLVQSTTGTTECILSEAKFVNFKLITAHIWSFLLMSQRVLKL